MVSTPSRSRQATRISLPDIIGPSSPLLVEVGFLISVCVVLLIGAFTFGCARGCTKKPTGLCEPWVIVEIQVTLDKLQRRRRLRRRPAESLVADYPTSGATLIMNPSLVKAKFGYSPAITCNH